MQTQNTHTVMPVHDGRHCPCLIERAAKKTGPIPRVMTAPHGHDAPARMRCIVPADDASALPTVPPTGLGIPPAGGLELTGQPGRLQAGEGIQSGQTGRGHRVRIRSTRPKR